MSVMLSRGVVAAEGSFEMNPGVVTRVVQTFDHPFSLIAAALRVTQGQPLNEIVRVLLTSASGKGPFILKQETLVDVTDWSWIPEGMFGMEVERGASLTLELSNQAGNSKVDMYLSCKKL